MPRFLQLWGKADRDESQNLIWHPLAYHMLDVAAVAWVWLEEDPNLKNLFLRISDLPEKKITLFFSIACALHDVGKATVYFQNKIPEITRESGLFHEIAASTTGFNHGSFGCHWIEDWREEEKEFQEWATNFPFLQGKSFLDLWKAASWHHGVAFVTSDYTDENRVYPKKGDHKPKEKDDPFDRIVSLRNETLQYVTQSICKEYNASILNQKLKQADPSFIRTFAGFVSVCDWIGSDKEHFKYDENPFRMGSNTAASNLSKEEYPEFTNDDNLDYWKIAKQNAKLALEQIGLIPESIEKITTFDKILNDEKTPRPIQRALEELQTDKPSLVIVEAPTGEGKTESAFFQFARNPGRGFYFGLPTQASANQISGRIEIFLKETMKTNEDAMLAHGNAWLVKAIAESKSYDRNLELKETKAESDLSEWFYSKKRTLLSRFGVGTVDQAMLSALNVKHGFVKLFGLSGKTLIIDEVHAYDSFMLPIIEHLLRWCGYLETSVVLLSATLPFTMKQRLISAYIEKDEIQLKNKSYPLLTIATKSDHSLKEIDSYKNEKIQTRKTESIPYSFFSHEDDSISEVIAKAFSIIEKGGNILWICNTVKKAQHIYQEIEKQSKEKQIENLEIILFHSRFTKIDRLTIEKNIETLYGDESKAPHRPLKSILVATQVAEQSLDIDFDFLITDIAPIDLILQRIGRIFRHERKNRNPNFKEPEILLLVPDKLEALKDFAGVYDKFTVLKTMYQLSIQEKHSIQLPFMYRSLVDAVYSDSIPDSEFIEFDSYLINIQRAQWEDHLKVKLRKKEDLHLKGSRGLIPPPTTEDPADSALLSEEENAYWHAKTRDGENPIRLILVYKNDAAYFVGNLPLRQTVPEKIPTNYAIAFAQNAVDVGVKDFADKAKKEKSLVSSYPIPNSWQNKIENISQFKGNKFILLEKDKKLNLFLSDSEYILDYDSVIGFQVTRV